MISQPRFILKCVVCDDALSAFVKNEDYHVKKAYVLSNTREITTNGKITYIPIYDVMFVGAAELAVETI